MAQEYVSLLSDPSHIERHFSGSLTAGSKFYPDASAVVLQRAEQELKKAFEAGNGAAGRVVLKLDFDRPIGTDALVELRGQPADKQHRLIRDSGTPYESVFTAVETAQKDIPQTHSATVIAGPYGPTGKWGIYTMFPGQEAPPFPSDKQPEDVRKANAVFWENNGFRATPEEIRAHPSLEPLPPPPTARRGTAPQYNR